MRAAKQARLQAGVELGATRTFAPVAAGINLQDNPNRGKRHAARMTDAFLAELAQCEARAYSPLTVSTPLTRTPFPRRASDRTQYTV